MFPSIFAVTENFRPAMTARIMDVSRNLLSSFSSKRTMKKAEDFWVVMKAGEERTSGPV